MKKGYWFDTGKYQKRYESLLNADKTSKLKLSMSGAELWHWAQIFYRDHYNNGDCNAVAWRSGRLTVEEYWSDIQPTCRELGIDPDLWKSIDSYLEKLWEHEQNHEDYCPHCGSAMPEEEPNLPNVDALYEQMMDVVITYVWNETRKTRRTR